MQHPVERDRLRRRQTQTVSETLDNEETLYFANVSIGTPGQPLRLHIDTGSSDLWANSPNSQLCQSFQDPCQVSGTYDPNQSSSAKLVSNDFNISYVDGSGAVGDYVSDTLHIGGQTLEGLQFGLGLASTSPEGILGIGYPSNEVQVNRNNKKSYANLPQALSNAKLTQSSAYSLWLDDLESSTGSILFGGVDTDKFHGTLSTLPIQQEFGTFSEFIITLSGLSLTKGGKSQTFSTDLPIPVLLDSGSSLTYLPNDLTQKVYSAVNAQFDGQDQTAVVSCDLAQSSDTLDFTFTDPKISVPMSELTINPGPGEDGSIATFADGSPMCIFGVSPTDGTTAVLGDTFIRSAYLVYDLSNNEISMAQTNFNATDSHVLEIGTGTAAVPSATVVPSPIQASVSQTGGARLLAPTATSTKSSGGSSNDRDNAAPYVGVAYSTLVVFGSVAVGFFLA